MESILVAVDGSEPSTRAVAVASHLAGRVEAEVVVLHVLRVAYSGAAVWTPDMSSRDAQALVDGAVEQVRAHGVQARGLVQEAPESQVAKEILAVADAQGAQLVVVGSRGLSRLASVVLGSTAYKILHLSDRPVLTVP
jgi:nucleotide-binding universal stress UspA family protein